MNIDTVNFFQQAGLNGKLRQNNKILWDHVLGLMDYSPVLYTNSSIDYQMAYQQGQGGDWEDFSLLIFLDVQVVAIWPLSLSKNKEGFSISSHGLPLLPPLFIQQCSLKSKKRIIKKCLNSLKKLGNNFAIASITSLDIFKSKSASISTWHQEILARNGQCHWQYELFVDLSLGIPQIKNYFRERYKPLISKSEHLWKVNILDSKELKHNDTAPIWNEFINLHLYVAGRKTRSDKTWYMQYQHILDNEAFLIYLRDDKEKMVGGGLFHFTKNEGCYSVGAYDRELFDKPIGHIVQYRAIIEFKKRNIQWYKIGPYPLATDTPAPTKKEISIGNFKQGFSTDIFPMKKLEIIL